MNYRESLDYIASINWKGSVPGLERITELMHKLGDPQNRLRYIHIGGTNGKGSACAFISGILKCAGYKTGLFISPYIETFNERMQINGQNISDEELAEITTYIRPFADSMEDAPTEFELNTAIAFLYFTRHKCDFVVLEVGMGGEFDATNVIKTPEVAAVTAISLDHTEYLGNTIEKIAKTKAGIIKPKGSVVLYQPQEEPETVLRVIKERCLKEGADLYLSEPDTLRLIHRDIKGQSFESPFGTLAITMPALYQKNNLALALKVAQVLIKKGFSISKEQIRKGVLETFWPGRFEILKEDPVFLVDGAHNPQGIKAAADSLKEVFPDRKFLFVLGVLADKDYSVMLDTILPLAKKVFCVKPDSPRALPADSLRKEVQKRNGNALAFASIREALDAVFREARKDDIICALGSLYMIGELKASFHESFHEQKTGKEEQSMKFSEYSCAEFTERLSSKEPVPGGGGAAALCAAIGTALGNMVGALTLGKKKYADVQPEIVELRAECDRLQEEFLGLIEEDAMVFRPLSDAYRLPSDTEEEQKKKKEILEKCSKDAAMVPMRIMEGCIKAIELTERFSRIGSRLAISDAGCSAVLLKAALKAASLNIFINTKGLSDREFAESLNKKADSMMEIYGKKADEIFEEIQKALR